MSWPWEVVERDHDIQNPTSAEKIRLLGEYLRLGSDSRVLDLACGKAGPALILASTFGCRIVGVEARSAFADQARARVAAAGLGSLIEVHTADASAFALEEAAWNAALCLGATFVWGHIGDAAEALSPAVEPGGFVAIGEPFWREWPLPEGTEGGDFVGLKETVVRFEASGLALTGVIAASEADWDRYKSLCWRAVEEWLAGHPEHPDADAIRSRHKTDRRDLLSFERARLGWAILRRAQTLTRNVRRSCFVPSPELEL
jgi:SAM-dependent methyltransferase